MENRSVHSIIVYINTVYVYNAKVGGDKTIKLQKGLPRLYNVMFHVHKSVECNEVFRSSSRLYCLHQ